MSLYQIEFGMRWDLIKRNVKQLRISVALEGIPS